jgi:hypothetical protein
MLPAATCQELVDSLDQFNPQYHRDFESVRAVAMRWLASDLPVPQRLPELLRNALASWGAGKRKAPTVRSPAQILAVLADPEVTQTLRAIATLDLSTLTLVNNEPRIGGVRHIGDQESVEELILSGLAMMERLFEDNGAVTYPSKALLLITGRFIGIDSNVRAAIAASGEPGFRETRFPMPIKRHDRSSRRLSRVLWLTGDWLWRHRTVIAEALTVSTARHRLTELDAPARIVDIFLFMQGTGQDG